MGELNSIKTAKRKIADQIINAHSKCSEKKRVQKIKTHENYEGYMTMDASSRTHDISGLFSQKWYEDTVFTNQSREEKKPCMQFINDTVRTDAHRQFLERDFK